MIVAGLSGGYIAAQWKVDERITAVTVFKDNVGGGVYVKKCVLKTQWPSRGKRVCLGERVLKWGLASVPNWECSLALAPLIDDATSALLSRSYSQESLSPLQIISGREQPETFGKAIRNQT